MNPEIVYLSHGNVKSLILKRRLHTDPAPVAIPLDEMRTITRMTLSLGTKRIDSDNGDSDPIQWAKDDYLAGEFRLDLGAQTITPGSYRGWLVVYDPSHATGQVWGLIPVYVVANVEAAPAP